MSGAERGIQLKVRRASRDDVHRDLARLHGDQRPGIPSGRVMILRVGGHKVRAMARARLEDQDRDEIALDDRLRDRLGVDLGQRYDFVIQEGGFHDEILWAWEASDATTRVTAQLAIISVVLGFVGLLLGLLSLCT